MKHKGGKGKKAPYSTVVMRIPRPIEEDVRRLVEEFFSKAVTGIEDKAVTGIEDKAVTGIEDKAVTGIEDKGVTGIEDKGVTGIDALEVKVRIRNILKKHKISMEDLSERLKHVYFGNLERAIPGIGSESVYQLMEAMSKYQLRERNKS